MFFLAPVRGDPGTDRDELKLGRRHLVIAAAVLVLCAGFALVSTGPGIGWSFLILLGVALGLAAAFLAAILSVKLDRMQADMDRLVRSLDGALRELASANERNTRGIGTLSDTIDRQIGGMLERIETQITSTPARPQPEITLTAGDNVVALGQPPRKAIGSGEPLPAGWADRPLELSLEPIVSLSRGAAAGFEVHANLILDDGSERAIRRLSPSADATELAAFERALVTAAAHASRRQLGAEGIALPLHVAISGALLADDAAVRDIASLVQIHPGLSKGLVFSIPAELFASKDPAVRAGLERLAHAEAAIAVEGWPAGEDGLERLKGRGVQLVKLPVDRLLDRTRVRRKALSGSDITEAAERANIAVQATGVALDEDAVALLDIGVDLMCGARFSAPRKLRALPMPDAAIAANG